MAVTPAPSAAVRSETVEAVTVAGSTSSEKVAVTVASRATPLALAVGFAPLTTGAVVSTRQVRAAGEASVPPSIVQARTSKVCGPSGRPV